MWSVDAYNYLEQHYPTLWIIEANSTYRGWFVGGNQTGEWGNTAFVTAHVAGCGALGTYFATQLRGTIKMGDTPSVVYLLRNTPEDPTQPGWGGRFVRLWENRKTVFDRLTTAVDQAEAFGVVEFVLPKPSGLKSVQRTRLLIDNRIPALAIDEGAVLRFRFSPRDAKVWPYVIESDAPELAGKRGAFTAVMPPPTKTGNISARHPNWWIDDPAPEAAEGVHAGAKHVNRWREEFLRDFAERMQRCRKGRDASPRRPRTARRAVPTVQRS
jgi:hypothetical protein